MIIDKGYLLGGQRFYVKIVYWSFPPEMVVFGVKCGTNYYVIDLYGIVARSIHNVTNLYSTLHMHQDAGICEKIYQTVNAISCNTLQSANTLLDIHFHRCYIH